MKMYSSYDDEPEELFLPLSQELYSEMYNLEMDDFREDFSFYASSLEEGSDILELGCGSGRMTRLLSAAGHRLTGVDLSPAMLQTALLNSSDDTLHFICMDMRQLALHRLFDAVVIPYNTLNLLAANSDVVRCLEGCRHHLKPGGKLLLQLHIPMIDPESHPDKTTFQFRVFDRPQGGKIIKETLRKMDYTGNRLEMSERYKIRPMSPGQPNSNYSHTMILNGSDRTTWLQLLTSTGFTVQKISTSYSIDIPSETPSSILMIALRREG